MLSRALFSVCVLFALLVPAQAQFIREPRGRKPPQPPMDPFAADGTVQAVMPPRIRMLTNTNQDWTIWVDQKATTHVKGTAEADYLRAGMFVRFTAEIDKRGSAKDKVAELLIFTPSELSPIGIWPEGTAPAAEGEDNFGGGFGGQPGGAMGGPRGPKATGAGVFTIAGRLAGARKGKYTVNAGRGLVRFELAEDAKIQVDFADYSVAKQGDKISITRGKMFRGRMGLAQANEMTIELSAPLTTAKKRPIRTKTPKTPRTTTQPKNQQPPQQPPAAEEVEEEVQP